MATVNQDLTIYRGEVVTLNFTMVPVPPGGIAGWEILFTAAAMATKERQHETTRLFTAASAKLIAVWGSVVDGPTGTFAVVLTDADTDVASGVYEYDCWRCGTGVWTLLAAGQLVVGGVARVPPAGVLDAGAALAETLAIADPTATVA